MLNLSYSFYMTAALLTAPAGTALCDEASCQDAVSHASLCECSCNGASHGTRRGVNHRLVAARTPITATTRASRLADAFADDSEAF